MSWKGRTFDSRRDRTFSEIHLRVDWDTVGLLVGTGLDRAITNRCPREADVCLSSCTKLAYEIPSAIPGRVLFHDRSDQAGGYPDDGTDRAEEDPPQIAPLWAKTLASSSVAAYFSRTDSNDRAVMARSRCVKGRSP